MDSRDYSSGLNRDYYRDPFPYSRLSTREYVTVLRTILYRDQDGTRLLSPPRPLNRDHFHGPFCG